MVRRRHGGLPDLALLQFAVAEKAEDTGRAVAERKAERKAERDRESLAERAGRDFDAGRLLGIRVTLEHRAQLAQCRKVVSVEVPCLG